MCRYGFNPGSALAILGRSDVAALAAVNTTLSAAAGTLSSLFLLMALEWHVTGEPVWDLLGSANGTLAGLVGITAGCNVVEVRAALCPPRDSCRLQGPSASAPFGAPFSCIASVSGGNRVWYTVHALSACARVCSRGRRS